MASDDDSQSFKPHILSMEKAALKRKRAALLDKLSRLSPEAIVSGGNKYECRKKENGTDTTDSTT